MDADAGATAQTDAQGQTGASLDLRRESLPPADALAAMGPLASLDLRGHLITTEQYDAFAAALPGCKILWSVPLSGGRYDSDTTALSLRTLPTAEVRNLCYFAALESLTLDTCAPETAAALLTLADDGQIHCSLSWRVEVCGVSAARTDTYLDLSGTEPVSLATLSDALATLPALTGVSLVNRPLANEEKSALAQAFPDICFYWTVEREGTTHLSTDEKLDFNVFNFTDIEEAAAFLHCFMHPETVDMATLGFVNEEMLWLSEAFPHTRFIWTIQLGRLALRTDATVFTGRSGSGGRKFIDADVDALRYCTDLIALDLSRNKLSDLSWVKELKNLRVLILSENQITDLSPLSGLDGLMTLNLANNAIEDVSALSSHYSLRDLNLTENAIMDAAPLRSNDSLEYLFLDGNPLSEGQEDALTASFPECKFDFSTHELLRAWRRTERAKAIERMWDCLYPDALFLGEE